MRLILFLLFIVVPIAEIAVFIEAGRMIGVPATIALTLATAFLGSFLLRMQGFAALQRFAATVEKGGMPIVPVIDGMGILVAGVLLLTPGLLTDLLGLLLFIPAVRHAAGRAAVRRLLASGNVHVFYHGSETQWSGPDETARTDPEPPPRGRDKGKGPRRSDNVVDAEFEEVDPESGGKKPAQLGNAEEPRKPGDTGSPWRKE